MSEITINIIIAAADLIVQLITPVEIVCAGNTTIAICKVRLIILIIIGCCCVLLLVLGLLVETLLCENPRIIQIQSFWFFDARQSENNTRFI